MHADYAPRISDAWSTLCLWREHSERLRYDNATQHLECRRLSPFSRGEKVLLLLLLLRPTMTTAWIPEAQGRKPQEPKFIIPQSV